MRKLVYSGLIASGLAGVVGCEKSTDSIMRENIINRIPEADIPVAKYISHYDSTSPSIAVGDMNGDRRNDIVLVSRGNIYVFLNNGNGSYSQQILPNRVEKVE